MIKKLLFTLILFTNIMTQLPEDDEVTATFPDYNHKIYSGNFFYI